MEKRYYSSLNIIRIISAVAIAQVYHYAIIYRQYPNGNNPFMSIMYTYGFFAVELFFLISVFVSMFGTEIKISHAEISFEQFFAKKVSRLFPMMIVGTIAQTIVQWINFAAKGTAVTDILPGQISILSVILSFMGTQSGWLSEQDEWSINGPAWYLAVLLVCYILFFIVVKTCKGDKWKEIILFVSLIMLGIYLQVKRPQGVFFPLLNATMGRGYTAFFTGAVLARIQTLCEKKYHRIFIMGVTFIVMLIFVWAANHNLSIALSIEKTLVFDTSLVLFFVNSKILNWIGNTKVFLFFGQISFHLFVLNVPILTWILFINQHVGSNVAFGEFYTMIIIGFIYIVISSGAFIIENKIRNQIEQIRKEKCE